MACKSRFFVTAALSLVTGLVQAQQGARNAQQAGGSYASQRAVAANQRLPGKALTEPDLSAVKELPEITNPVAIQEETAASAVLASQKRSVDTDVMAQMKLGIRAASAPVGAGSKTMASQTGPLLGGGAANRAPALSPPKSGNASSTVPFPSGATSSIGSSSAGTINPPVAGSTNPKFGSMPVGASGNVALTCSTNPAMRILSVAGTLAPAVFTPIPDYDLYTVSGCSFGTPGPDAQVYIYKGGTFKKYFQIEEWHDNWLKLSLDVKISGVLDQDDVTLVVQRADRTQASKGGFKFHAARAIVPLQVIPSRWAHLVVWKQNKKTFSPEYSSPALIDGKSAGPSAYVSRFVDGEKFDPSVEPPDQQYDTYDFAKLAPGWMAKSARLETFAMTCGTKYQPIIKTYEQKFGTWRAEWVGRTLHVYLADESCSGFDAAMPLVNYQNLTGSYYRLTVAASGPRCTDPITGNSDQECVKRVQGAP